jgi:hypothetical protein
MPDKLPADLVCCSYCGERQAMIGLVIADLLGQIQDTSVLCSACYLSLGLHEVLSVPTAALKHCADVAVRMRK